MRVYLANVDSWTFPNRGSDRLHLRGLEVGGNWLAPPFQYQLEEFAADVVIYAPHRRVDALVLRKEDVLRVPTLLWALYPDYLTGWDRKRNVHMDGFLESVAEIMPYFPRHAVNSFFTKQLLEERIAGYQFEVCCLGLDLETIDSCRKEKRTESFRPTVLWQHRWRTDKNLRGALVIIEARAGKYRDVSFLIGRYEDWDEPYWVPQALREYVGRALRGSPVSGTFTSYVASPVRSITGASCLMWILRFRARFMRRSVSPCWKRPMLAPPVWSPARLRIPRFTVEPC